MNLKFFILIVCIGICSTSLTYKILDQFEHQPAKEIFKVWHFIHQKTYNINSEEALNRYKIFKENMKYIKETNSAQSSFKLGYGPFADMTFEEFKKIYSVDLGVNPKLQFEQSDDYNSKFLMEETSKSPDMSNTNSEYVQDWSQLYDGARTQGVCGACWAFAEAGTIEGRLAQRDRTFRPLSAQQLVSCDQNQTGCNGGWASKTGMYSQQVGLVDDRSYPYTSQSSYNSGTCNNSIVYSKYRYRIQGSRYCDVMSNSRCLSGEWESSLLKGPIYAVIYMTRDFMLFRSGILDSQCSGNSDHAVIATNVTPDTIKIRNSFGPNWGESGYARVRRSRSNNFSCWLEYLLWYPIV